MAPARPALGTHPQADELRVRWHGKQLERQLGSILAIPAADELINAIPTETDPAKLKEYYTELVKIYLTDVPSFTLMYRPTVSTL